MRFAFISEEKVAFPVAVLCRVLAVSPSGYYASQGRPASLHARRDQDLSERIAAIHHGSRRRYGSPRVHADLKASGDRVGCKRVARLMRENKLVARCRHRFRTTTDSKHSFPIAPNVLERNFTALRPNQSWVTDITFLWTQQGWLYLAVILDLFSRRVVGWATSRNVDRHLALAALAMALCQRQPGSGLVHHSDRGSTYASECTRLLPGWRWHIAPWPVPRARGGDRHSDWSPSRQPAWKTGRESPRGTASLAASTET